MTGLVFARLWTKPFLYMLSKGRMRLLMKEDMVVVQRRGVLGGSTFLVQKGAHIICSLFKFS
jgi:hypothetical protein